VQRNTDRGGLVLGPAVDDFRTDSPGVAIKPLTDLVVDDVLERALSRLGFLPLCQCKEMPSAAFYSCPSIQRSKKYDKADAQLNAKLSSMLNYILCASRFAHYTKVIVRDILGSLVGPEEIERRLQDWIVDYVNRDPDADVDSRSRRPLQAAEIRVRPIPGRPGEYDSILHLSPNHELDDVQASIRLDTRLAPRRT
jgi:type VI secretion system protein ImpD